MAFFVGASAGEESDDEHRSSEYAGDALASIGPPAVPPLIEALADRTPEVRIEAARALGNIGDARAVEPLGRLLADRRACVRIMAARALGAISGPRAVEILSAACADTGQPDRVRLAAGEGLAECGPAGRAALIAMLRGPSPGDRQIAAASLLGSRNTEPPWEESPSSQACLTDQPADPGLLEALVVVSADPDARTAACATEVMRRYRDPRVTEALLSALRYDSASVRTRAANGLTLIEEPRAVAPLAAMLDVAADEGECQVAANAIRVCGGPRAAPVLESALANQRPFVRAHAALALGRMHEVSAAGAIAALLADAAPAEIFSDPAEDSLPGMHAFNHKVHVQVFAAMALADLGDGRGAGILVDTLGTTHSSHPTLTPAHVSLMRIGPEAVAPLLALAADPKKGWVALESLARISDGRAAAALAQAARDPFCPARAAAVEALGRIGDSGYADLLASLAEEDGLRLPALVSLARVGDRRALAPLLDRLDGCGCNDACRVVTSLGYLGDPRAVEPILSLLEDRRAHPWPPPPGSARPQYVDESGFRKAAAIAVLRIGDERGIRMVLECYADDSARGWWNIFPVPWDDPDDPFALLLMSGQAARGPLEAALADDNPRVVETAAEALVRLTGPRAIGPLWAAFAGAKPETRRDILWKMKSLALDVVTDFLCEVAAGDPDDSVRRTALDVLKERGGPVAIEALRRATGDTSAETRRTAWQALSELTHEPLPPGIRRDWIQRQWSDDEQ